MKTALAQNIAMTASLILSRDLKITAATAKPTIEPSKNSAAMMIDAKPAVTDIGLPPFNSVRADKFWFCFLLWAGVSFPGLAG